MPFRGLRWIAVRKNGLKSQYGIYRTRIRTGEAGSNPTCQFRNPNAVFRKSGRSRDFQLIREISTRGTNELRILYSPGFQLIPQENYANQMIVIYNISCADDELAFYNITEIDLQEKCGSRCVDYVGFDRGGFGVTESCGNAPDDNMLSLNTNSFSVTFRTSTDAVIHSGFRVYVICFKREAETSFEGCTTSGDPSPMNESAVGNARRKKRDLVNFHNIWRRTLRRERIPFLRLLIQFGNIVSFNRGVITIIRGETTQSVHVVRRLFTFDRMGVLDVFTGNQIINFTEAGPLYIAGDHAFYQRFVFDSRGIIPNPDEAEVITTVTAAIFDTIPPSEDVELVNRTLPELNRTMVDEDILDLIVPDRFTRQAEEEVTPINDDGIREAIRNERACNPVVRTLSVATLGIAVKENRTRVEELRAEVARESVICPDLVSANVVNVTGLMIDQGGLTVGSTATYNCSNGLVLLGNATRECLQSGNWSGLEPICANSSNIQISCQFLFSGFNNSFNISLDCTSNVEMITYRCRIDDMDAFNCEVPFTSTENLSPGVHVFTIITDAIDPATGQPLHEQMFLFPEEGR